MKYPYNTTFAGSAIDVNVKRGHKNTDPDTFAAYKFRLCHVFDFCYGAVSR